MYYNNQLKSLAGIYHRIDHVAVAVLDLEQAISDYQNIWGFDFVERRETSGEKTGMISAVMKGNEFTIVLIQGLQELSQVSQYIKKYGPGVQHLAIKVDNLESVVSVLRDKGVSFATNIITGPGLRQIFSKREPNSGMMFEFIERTDNDEFLEDNINDLFSQMEHGGVV